MALAHWQFGKSRAGPELVGNLWVTVLPVGCYKALSGISGGGVFLTFCSAGVGSFHWLNFSIVGGRKRCQRGGCREFAMLLPGGVSESSFLFSRWEVSVLLSV